MQAPEIPAHPHISAVLITKNAGARLHECLDSLKWAGEIVVLDSGSSDNTEAICAAFHARFSVESDWPGFGIQKNRALALATGDWVFSIDADEICTPELRAEIQDAVSRGDAEAYALPRLSNFCGHWMRHGGWWPDHVTRLFRRNAASFSDDVVHERLIVEGRTGLLKNHLLHYTYDTLDQALEKMNRYSTLGAEQAFRRGKRASLLTAWLRGGWAFLRTYFLRAGFLDGTAGYVLARYNAQGTYYKYLKLRYLGKL
ncbi:MAG: glycosyltransferase family 2 protein [Stenotrophobium sp.]